MSTFPVTGGVDFIGSNIVEELLRRGEIVRVIDNFSSGRPDYYPADATGCPPSLYEVEVGKIPGNPV